MEQTRQPRLRRWRRFFGRQAPPPPPTTIDLTIPPPPPMTQNTKLPPPPPQVPACDVCTDTEAAAGPLKSICRSCTTQYCQKCVRELFLRAIKSPTSMPAKCCEMIPIHVGSKLLSKEEATEYRVKFEEWKTDAKDRVYCPKSTCSAFIPLKQLRAAGKIPEEITGKEKRDSKDPAVPSLEQLTSTPTIDCPKCTTVICVTCKSFDHPMEPCKAETQNDEMLALLLKWGYKRCPRCGHGTRKMFGCSHMQCICGAHWCWGCERGFNECERDGGCQWDEDDDDEMEYDSVDGESDEDSGEEATTAEVEMINTDAESRPEQENATDSFTLAEVSADSDPPSPVIVMGPITEREDRRQRRAENLDAGGGRYWERQDLDFGSEPGDAEDTVWGCEHKWNELPEITKMWDDDGVECHQCWDPISEKGHVKYCDWCGLMACGKCAEGGK